MKRRNDCSLLPHTREYVYGLSYSSAQIIGWEINKFNIPLIWKTSQGNNVTVGVIDTGCDLDHPDIKNNLLQGKNFVGKGDPADDNGHGTHVSGTIAAENNGLGMVGISPKTKILPIKALNADGNGNNTNIAKAIAWAADNKCDFIALSLGSPYDSKDILNAIKYAYNKKCMIFCAAGNSGKNVGIMYPAKYEQTIAIGSIDKNLNRSEFTCSGPELDFLSPGQEILSCVPNDNYAIMSGTSMSNPFAVGCASLLLGYAKSINKQNLLNKKEDYIRIFSKYTKHLKNKQFAGKKEYEGYGILYPTTEIF